MIELSDLLAATGGQVATPIGARQFSRISYDSRLLPQWQRDQGGDRQSLGPLFVAVKTEKGDGHDFIADAVAKGATGVLCQRLPDPSPSGVTCIVVADTREALIAYARFAMQRAGLVTVGITGSTGKTTAKELIATVLAEGPWPVFRNQGSINGRYGLSIAAGDLEPRHRLAVLELAADSFDEIRDLAELTKPQVGVLTAVSETHVATFGSLDAIAAEKGRLLEALPPEGLAVLNADDARVMALAGRTQARIVTVGSGPDALIRAKDVTATAEGLRFQVDICDHSTQPSAFIVDRSSIHLHSSLLGRHQVPLLLSAVAVGLWFGLPIARIVAALAAFQPLPGRLRPLPGRHGLSILDDTASASPAAAVAALDTLALFADRPRVAVLGDMWDLAHEEVAAHRRVGRHAVEVADLLVVKGQRAQEIATGALEAGMAPSRVFRAYTDEDVLRFLEKRFGGSEGQRIREAGHANGSGLTPQGTARRAQDAESSLRDGPIILVKGDRPARMERIVAGLLAEPARAGELLVRQSAGWRQVQLLTQDRPTWVEIDLEAVAGNVRQARAVVGPDVAICAVLKADAYGHGAVGVARTALNNGAQLLGVACLAEAVTLRRAGIDAPILALGYTPAWQARDTLRHDVTATVYDLDVARALSQAAADLNRPARVHVKVDTGMGRLGLLSPQVVPFVRELAILPGIEVEGIFTHLSVADSADPAHRAHTLGQLEAFRQVLADLAAAGLAVRLAHAANSAALIAWPAAHFNLVRLGIALYGLSPSAEMPLPPGFRPALSWKTQVAQVKLLPPGWPISYGNTFQTTRETAVAVIPVGYADGFRRGPQHWGHVLVRGRQAPIVGRVTMDQTMLDVSHIGGVRQGDEVVLIGRQGDQEITVDQVAERLGTVNYEVVSEILARVPRVM